MNDAETVRAIAEGREDAFREILERFEARIFGFALALTRSSDEAADVTQDTFLVLLRKPGAYDPERGTLGGYLLGIARNIALRHMRRARRELPLHPEFDMPAEEEGIDVRLEIQHEIKVVWHALDLLTPIQRQVVYLRFREEMSLDSIAGTLLLPINTVKSHLRRGVQRMRLALRAKGSTDDAEALPG